MNNAYISALAALAGSGIGALASVGTTWLTQRYQDRSQRSSQISARLEQLFGEFIDQASRVFADALTHQLDDLSKLVPLYATMGKLRLHASNATVACADRVMSRILDAYYSPNVNFETERIRDAENYDVLRAFIAACQTELKKPCSPQNDSQSYSSSDGDGQRELELRPLSASPRVSSGELGGSILAARMRGNGC